MIPNMNLNDFYRIYKIDEMTKEELALKYLEVLHELQEFRTLGKASIFEEIQIELDEIKGQIEAKDFDEVLECIDIIKSSIKNYTKDD